MCHGRSPAVPLRLFPRAHRAAGRGVNDNRSSANARSSSTSLCRRSATMPGGTCPGKQAAGAPGRELKEKTWIFEKPTSRARQQVASKSASVSPGKPTMTSVVSAGRSSASAAAGSVPGSPRCDNAVSSAPECDPIRSASRGASADRCAAHWPGLRTRSSRTSAASRLLSRMRKSPGS